jgi:probable phosphoglycerate mutase
VYTSPLARASETAELLIQTWNVPLITAEPLAELSFGDWTGKSFAELDSLPEWMAFNARRSSSRPPGGESLQDAQSRVMPFLKVLAEKSMRAVVLVTHADIIKTVVMTVLGAPLDCLHRFDIDPASITIIDFDGTSAQLRALNLSPLLSMASRLHPSLAG